MEVFMNWVRWLVSCLALAIFLAAPLDLSACPLCREAISSSGPEEEEINLLPAAYNQSIYLMVSVPYLLLFGGGFLVYRGYQKNQQILQKYPQGQ
jgi:hypothetical protein